MKILVIGASGFIGGFIYEKLLKRGFDVVAGVRSVDSFEDEAIKVDFLDMQREYLFDKLKDFDVVINAVGIIAPIGKQSFEVMHTIAPIKLFDMAKEVGVKRIIQISALGSKTGTTPYHRSKDRADSYLRKLGVDYAILHPSLVYGSDGKSSALFRAISSLPIIPIIESGEQKLMPILIDDLANVIVKIVKSDQKEIELDVVGSEVVTYKEMLKIYREWLGYRDFKSFRAPTVGVDLIGKVLGESTINSDNIKMLRDGSTADMKPFADFLGYTPVGFSEGILKDRADNAQKLYASLYLIAPILRLVIGFVWIWSGVVSAFLFPQEEALKLLHEVGIPSSIDKFMLYVASILDIGIGILTLIGYKLQKNLIFQMIVIVTYTTILTIFAPYHWLHPFGPILKNIPLLFAIYILGRLEKFR